MPFDPNPALPADVRSEPTLREFAEWVGRQDPGERYEWAERATCAIGMFLKATGRSLDLYGDIGDRSFRAHNVLKKPWTFGALASRLEALSESPAS